LKIIDLSCSSKICVFQEALIMNRSDLAVTYDPNWLQQWANRFVNPLDDAESFQIDRSTCLISEIGNKPETVGEVQGQYMGLLLFSPKGWQGLQKIRNGLEPEICDKIDMTSILQLMIESDYDVQGVPTDSEWGEFDSKEDILGYQKFSQK
jgi:L-glutamine-phosphate cytidylyltransferase